MYIQVFSTLCGYVSTWLDDIPTDPFFELYSRQQAGRSRVALMKSNPLLEEERKLMLKTTRRNFLKSTAAAGLGFTMAGFDIEPAQAAAGHSPICIFSKHLQFLDYEPMAEAAAEIGFDGIDLTVRPGGHVLPENVERDLPRAVKAVEKAGLQVNMMTTRITDPADKTVEPILRTASDLGITFYRMGYLRYDHEKGIAQSLYDYRPMMQELAELNEKYGMHGAYQNHSGTRVGGPVWDIWVMIRDIDPRYLGCQYDVRHATLEGGYSWPLGFELLKPFVKITAIKDFVWEKQNGEWKHSSVPLGEGMVDFKTYFDMVKRFNVQGPISLHFEYDMPGDELSLSVRTQRTIEVMQKDVQTLRKMIGNAGI
jgi:sugar phosphate isomerase/epimerase